MGRVRKKESLLNKHCLDYNLSIVYKLRISTTTRLTDRFNTKEQAEWCEEHDEEVRTGTLLRIGEVVPDGDIAFRYKDLLDFKKPDVNRRFIAHIKDNNENYEFYINLWNVELDEDILDKIFEDFAIPSNWVNRRLFTLDKIGKSFDRIIYENKINGRNKEAQRAKAKTASKKKKAEADFFDYEKRIGRSKSRYKAAYEDTRRYIRYYKAELMKHTRFLEGLKEYWEEVKDSGNIGV